MQAEEDLQQVKENWQVKLEKKEKEAKKANISADDQLSKIKQHELSNLKLSNQIEKHLSDIAELKHDFDNFKTTAENELKD